MEPPQAYMMPGWGSMMICITLKFYQPETTETMCHQTMPHIASLPVSNWQHHNPRRGTVPAVILLTGYPHGFLFSYTIESKECSMY